MARPQRRVLNIGTEGGIVIDFHPLANRFPLIEDDEFDRLVEDIRVNGQRDAIVLFEGRILDGRNRYRACLEAGVTPKTRDFDPAMEGPPEAFVISQWFEIGFVARV
jgi:hypothetical protein